MAQAEIYKLMGPPTSTYPDGEAKPESASWDGYGYSFSAFFDENGNARKLQYLEDELSPEQRAKLTCKALRS